MAVKKYMLRIRYKLSSHKPHIILSHPSKVKVSAKGSWPVKIPSSMRRQVSGCDPFFSPGSRNLDITDRKLSLSGTRASETGRGYAGGSS